MSPLHKAVVTCVPGIAIWCPICTQALMPPMHSSMPAIYINCKWHQGQQSPTYPTQMVSRRQRPLQCIWHRESNHTYNVCVNIVLKLPFLFAAWLLFFTFHNTLHNMTALVILSHSWSPFLPHTCLYEKRTFVGLSVAFWSIFTRKKNPPRLPMQITCPWPPVGRFSHSLIIVRQKKM